MVHCSGEFPAHYLKTPVSKYFSMMGFTNIVEINERNEAYTSVFLQTQIIKEYPNELTVIFFYNLSVSLVAAVVGLITERNSSAWILEPNIALVSVVCSVRN